MYARITASHVPALRDAVTDIRRYRPRAFLGAKRRQRAQTASFGREPATDQARLTPPQPETMAEEKKSRACHYLQPQEWWFADKTPIESVFLMMC